VLTHRLCSWLVDGWPNTAHLDACADGGHRVKCAGSAEMGADSEDTQHAVELAEDTAYHGTRRPVSGGLAKKDEFHRAMSGPMHCDTMLRMSGSRQYSRNARS
jgi:hypothetical protein